MGGFAIMCAYKGRLLISGFFFEGGGLGEGHAYD